MSARSLLRTTAVAGVLAAAAATVLAVAATAVDVPLEVDGAEIPAAAFAWWSLIGAALGGGLARLLGDRRRFVAVTSIALALSLVPAVAAPDHRATKVVLVAGHLLVAAIVVPTLARRIGAGDDQAMAPTASASGTSTAGVWGGGR